MVDLEEVTAEYAGVSFKMVPQRLPMESQLPIVMVKEWLRMRGMQLSLVSKFCCKNVCR